MGLDAGVNVFVVRDGRDGDAVRSDGMAVVVSPDPFANGACSDVREVERDSEDEGGSVVPRNFFMFRLYHLDYVGIGQERGVQGIEDLNKCGKVDKSSIGV
jgi:hypothetical protein